MRSRTTVVNISYDVQGINRQRWIRLHIAMMKSSERLVEMIVLIITLI